MTKDMNNLVGAHHVTAITSYARKIFEFHTKVLGLHLIKKTVNQDDAHTYHLYFTDDMGTAGTDITFFDFPGIQKGQPGTNSISRTTFRVPNDASLEYWGKRLDDFNIDHEDVSEQFGAKMMKFRDFDDQQYAFVSDEHNAGVEGGTPWRGSDVPDEYAIVGLGPVYITVMNAQHMDVALTDLLGFTRKETEGDFTKYELNDGGHGAQVIIEHREDLPIAIQGYGSVHHAAFTTNNEESLRYWIDCIQKTGLSHSGFVDRFYFKSEYFRVTPGVLFEIATNGPGFLQDETYEESGIHLELPPFLEPYREEIEANLTPVNTGAEDGA
ncbi:glyoxalase [Secundilactobacillus oryzae JCM 18671]|uniref:Glyoxalase n=1 Tax=Secundilactobacillus oryzae JCM 18671 TaxID=1291743 RepID=A0A081BGI7_9LACO|nr:ring-cleaving dioxygenase [Secundilactobacillus oryzae]GAK47155.1 glyoxalase [Secundilactobacillus oryzae JCM 18671]